MAAPWAPSGPQEVILASDFVALLVHESCGHPTELDRVLGWEAAFAGTSFLMPEMRGSFRYGSPLVNMTADSLLPGGVGTFVAAGSGGLYLPTALAFGPDRSLYVCSFYTNQILRYDGKTGAFLNAFLGNANDSFTLSTNTLKRAFVDGGNGDNTFASTVMPINFPLTLRSFI